MDSSYRYLDSTSASCPVPDSGFPPVVSICPQLRRSGSLGRACLPGLRQGLRRVHGQLQVVRAIARERGGSVGRDGR
eukprot:768310-Hanusia_phi.AAC.5